VASAWDVYRKTFVFAQPHVIVRTSEASGKARYVETLTWISAAAPDNAPDSVKKLWAQMQSCCEEATHQGLRLACRSLVRVADWSS